MGKILALDPGDQWVGSALSDSSKMLARPFRTVPLVELELFLESTLTQEKIEQVVIGYPKTMRGTISQQTQKIIDLHKKLAERFPQVPFILWDERLSSKRAQTLSPARTPQEKQRSHSVAAAFVLDSFLEHLLYQKDSASAQ